MNKELTPLEALYKLKSQIDEDTYFQYDNKELLYLIETALKEYETLQDDFNKLYERTYKEHKALELLKRNLVIAFEEDNGIDLPTLVVGIKVDKNKLCVIYSIQDKDEIDLLKEVLS